jgi:UDP-N-acetylglucosamine 1-carboxyvinyltransferase
MEYIVINGGARLSGEISVNGAKNAAVAIIPAALACEGRCVIENLPNIEDAVTIVEALKRLGANCKFRDSHTLEIDCSGITEYRAAYKAVKRMRASYYMLGALLGRFGKAEAPLPGGCNFGVRPVDQHIKGFEALGAAVKVERGVIKASAEKLVGANIYLDMVSVGATINIMLAAIRAEGTTVIENAAKEPHVVDTANFLNTLGANVRGAGTDVIKIRGVNKLHSAEYMIIPDQIEAGTYMIAAAITGGDVTVKNIIPRHMDSLTAKLREMNCVVTEYDDSIRVISDGKLKSANVKTMTYPGFPTDLQPQMTALLCACEGRGIITETVWDNRFQYVTELKRLGCDIIVEGRVAIIEGGAKMSGAEVSATDLRAGAALVVAGLAAEGLTTIGNVKYIDRGYENVEQKLRALGADIRRVTI